MFNLEKVIVVGIDGATFDIIDELTARGGSLISPK